MLRVIVKVGQAHLKHKPWSLVRDFTGGSEAGNCKSCWKSGFMGSCVADCPEFDTSRGAPGWVEAESSALLSTGGGEEAESLNSSQRR